VGLALAGPHGYEMTNLTRSELLGLVYRFYPRGVHCYDRLNAPPGEPFYDDTEEHRRLVEAANSYLDKINRKRSRRATHDGPRAEFFPLRAVR